MPKDNRPEQSESNSDACNTLVTPCREIIYYNFTQTSLEERIMCSSRTGKNEQQDMAEQAI